MTLYTLAAFLGILTLSAFFSGTETALTALSPVQLRHHAERGDQRAKLLERLLRDRSRVIAALLVGNNVVNVVLAVYATIVFDGMLADSILPHWAAPIVASVAAVGVLLVFGEVLPKSIAVAFRTRWALLTAYPVLALVTLLSPVTWVLSSLTHALMRLFGNSESEGIRDVGELQTMARMGEQAGVIDNFENELIQHASEMNDTRVREIMTPRTDIVALEHVSSLEDVQALFNRTPFSRIPVYVKDLDDIVGVLNFKEILRLGTKERQRFDLRSFLHPPLFVPEAMFIGDLLSEMRARRTHLAFVLDEYGGTSGLITLEDVVERLVGRIDDEYDVVTTLIERQAEDTWAVDGRLTVDDLLKEIGIELDERALEGFDTAAGLALKAFGNIPAEGETAAYHRLEITVARVRGRRVRRMLIKLLPQDSEISGRSGRRRTTRILKQAAEKQAEGES